MFLYSFFSPSRHLEKCAEVFEKLRVSIFLESLAYLIFIYFHRIMSVCVCVCVCVLQKLEDRGASDQELKLTELLRYYTRDIQAAKVTLRVFFSSVTLHWLHTLECIIQPNVLDWMFYSYFQNGVIVEWQNQIFAHQTCVVNVPVLPAAWVFYQTMNKYIVLQVHIPGSNSNIIHF